MYEKLTPADVADLTGVKPESLRNWRRAGLAPWLGQESGSGRYHYSPLDIVAISAAKSIEALGVDLASSLAIAFQIRIFLSEILLGEDHYSLHMPECPLIACWPNELTNWKSRETLRLVGKPASAMQFVRLTDLNRLTLYARYGATVIHLQALAESLPEAVKSLYRASERR